MLKKLEEYSQPCSDQERSARLCNKSQSARCRKTESAFSASCNWLNNEVRGGNQRNMWCLSCAHVVPMLCLCCAYVVPMLCLCATSSLQLCFPTRWIMKSEVATREMYYLYSENIEFPTNIKTIQLSLDSCGHLKHWPKGQFWCLRKPESTHSPPKHVRLSFSFKPIRSNQGVWHQAGLIKGPGILDH